MYEKIMNKKNPKYYRDWDDSFEALFPIVQKWHYKFGAPPPSFKHKTGEIKQKDIEDEGKSIEGQEKSGKNIKMFIQKKN